MNALALTGAIAGTSQDRSLPLGGKRAERAKGA